jgi:hypothetical protein
MSIRTSSVMRASDVAALTVALGALVALAQAAPAQSYQRTSAQGLLVSLAPHPGPVRIGQFQSWVATLRDREGRPVSAARIFVDGGMPAHGHGLPTQPQVTRYLGDGQYLIEGVRFNMAGLWVWRLRIETPAGRDEVQLDLAIDY